MPDFVPVAAAAEIPPGTAARVLVGDTPVAIYNVDGQFFATGDICSHAHASLSEGPLTGHVIECTRHGAKFDVRDGRQLCFPAVRPVKSYAVRVEDGQIYVAVD
jgi:nitrite reductase/ring-hydroxylating ferredoxin subunit